MLAWHGRIPRRPIGSWIMELKDQAQGVGASLSDQHSGLFACSIFNQAAFIAALAGEPCRAQRLLEAQRTFVEEHVDHFAEDEHLEILNQIVVNEIRLLRACGASEEAVVLAEIALCALPDDQSPDAIQHTEGRSIQNAIADLQIELCKSLFAAHRPETGSRCEAIALAPGTERVLRGVSAEVATMFYLERGDQVSLSRLQEALSDSKQTSHIIVMRRLQRQAKAGEDIIVIMQMASTLAKRAELLSSGKQRFIDHLFYAEVVADILHTLKLYELESRVLRAMRNSARALRDLPFFVKTTHLLSGRSDRAKDKLFPIYCGHTDTILRNIDELEDALNCLKLYRPSIVQ